MIRQILDAGGEVKAYDPLAREKAKVELPTITYCESAYQAAQETEALIVATEWEEFQQLDWALIRQTMSRPLILDGRNFLQADTMRALGFEYYGVGRPLEEPAREAIA